MAKMKELSSVALAKAEHEASAKRLVAAMEKALPVGMYVEIPWGNGFLRGTVTGHGCWWATPAEVTLKLSSNGRHKSVSIGHLIPDEAG